MHQQHWLRIGGIAAAAAVMVVFAANASAGPVAGTSHSATQRSESGFGSEVRNAAASVISARKATAKPAVAQSPEAVLASTLSAAQLAGQRVIYSYFGFTPPSALLKLIRHGEVGGVIFFSSNFENATQFTAAVTKLIANNSLLQNPAHNFPLLLMVDQEGGEVRRLPGAPVDSEKFIGSQPNAAALATPAGTGAGENLLSFGLNVNLAPVLDVFRAPGDFDDQFQRSYSMNPAVVSTLGADFITAQQATGVAATAKHFPGLGAATASQNTDNVPVTITLSKATLQSVDELPYQAAIAAGVKLVLVSWAKYPNLGSSAGRPVLHHRARAAAAPAGLHRRDDHRRDRRWRSHVDRLDPDSLVAGRGGRHAADPVRGANSDRGRERPSRTARRLQQRHAQQLGLPGHRDADPDAAQHPAR